MATIECNNGGQDGFSPTASGGATAENGIDALPEEKALSIDYSEDLWLAEESSSGTYGKVDHGSESQLDHLEKSEDEAGGDDKKNGEDFMDQQQQHHHHHHQQVWSDGSAPQPAGAVVRSTTGYMNGGQNGPEVSGEEEEERNFAPLVPAGTAFTHDEGMQDGGDGHDGELIHHHHHQQQQQQQENDKTFTSLMPAAAMGVNGEQQHVLEDDDEEEEEVEAGSFTTMLNSAPQHDSSGQVVYYNPTANPQEQEPQMSVPPGNDNHQQQVYVPMDALEEGAQDGNYTVLSPALMAGQTVVSAPPGSSVSFHNISTLPFPQGNTDGVVYTTTAVGAFDNLGNPVQQQQAPQHQQIQFVGDPVAASLQQNAIDLRQEEEDDEDDEEMLAGAVEEEEQEDNSLELVGFTCPVCNETLADQASLDEHMAQHPPVKTFVCQTCGKSFATRRYLKYHRKNHCKRAGSYEGRDLDENDPNGEIKRFICNFCSRPFRVLKCMKVHKKKKHGILKEFTCHTCAVTYNSAEELVEHTCEPKPVEQVEVIFSSTQPGSIGQAQPLPQSQPQHLQQHTSTTTAVLQLQHQGTVTATLSAPSAPSVTPLAPATPAIATPTATLYTGSSQKSKRKLKQARPVCDICGKTFSDRISVDIHRVKHIEEEKYPCDMCDHPEGCAPDHVAHYFRIRFFTDDNQHLLEDQKIAAAAKVANQQQIAVVSSSLSVVSPLVSSATVTNVGQNGPLQVQGNIMQASGFDYATANNIGNPVVVSGAGGPGYVVSQGEAILMGQGTLLLAPQQAQQAGMEGQQLVEATDYEEGEVIHDANGSIISVAGTAQQQGQQAQQPPISIPPLPPKPQPNAAKKKAFKRSKVNHVCDICNKTFADAGKLELHYKSNHLDDRPYQCDVCDKSFFTKWKLQRHMLSHLEQKPHSCPMCSKSFVERGKLEAHYRTHLGTKPYKCDQCPKAFTVKSQLSIHKRRIHSSDQPFGCLVCGKAFLWKSGLEKHMRKHTREKPYTCTMCTAKYSNKANLVVHMTKAHNMTYQDPATSGKSPTPTSSAVQQQVS